MSTEEFLIKTQKERVAMERIKRLEEDYDRSSKKVEFLRSNIIKSLVVGTLFHMFGFLCHPVLPFIGLGIYLMCIVVGWKFLDLEEKVEQLKLTIKEKRKDLSRGKVETLLELPSPQPNIQYQDSVTTYDKKIVRSNRR